MHDEIKYIYIYIFFFYNLKDFALWTVEFYRGGSATKGANLSNFKLSNLYTFRLATLPFLFFITTPYNCVSVVWTL